MKQTTQKGFTLIEMLVVITVFSITVVAVCDLFMLNLKYQRRVAETQKLENNIRYVSETIIRAMRQGMIDYAYYSTLAIDLKKRTSVLALRDKDNNQIVWRYASNGVEYCMVPADSDDDQKCADPLPSEGDWTRMEGNSLFVEDFAFYISPDQSPFALKRDGSGKSDGKYAGGNVHPRVTFVFKAKNIPESPSGLVRTASLQTTVSMRIYKR